MIGRKDTNNTSQISMLYSFNGVLFHLKLCEVVIVQLFDC